MSELFQFPHTKQTAAPRVEQSHRQAAWRHSLRVRTLMKTTSSITIGVVRAKSVEAKAPLPYPLRMRNKNPFRYFKTSPEIIRLAVMMYIRFPLSLRNVEDLLHERGIDISHETARFWWTRFGPMFAAEIRQRRVEIMRSFTHWQWHLDEVFVKINGETHYLWRAVDDEGEVLEAFVSKRRDRKAALKFLKTLLKRHGNPEVIVTDKLWSYAAALAEWRQLCAA